MSHFNPCSQLIENAKEALSEYQAILENNKDPVQVMIDMQTSLQKLLAKEKPEMNPDPESLDTAGKVLDWLRINKCSIDDEFRELLTSLGGMSNGDKDASGVWKAWKSNNLEKRNTLISSLSPEDQLEIKFEAIDMMHFIFNMLISLGITGEELFTLYYLKNAENFNRQKNNY